MHWHTRACAYDCRTVCVCVCARAQGQPCITLGDIMKGLTVDPEQKKRKDMLGNDVMTIYLKLVDSVVLPNGRTQVKAKYMCAVRDYNIVTVSFAHLADTEGPRLISFTPH